VTYSLKLFILLLNKWQAILERRYRLNHKFKNE